MACGVFESVVVVADYYYYYYYYYFCIRIFVLFGVVISLPLRNLRWR